MTCAVLAATLVSACKTEERRVEPATPSTATPPSAAPTTPGTAPGEQGGAGTDPDLAAVTVTVVDIDTKLAAMCGVPESKVYFKYDSAKLVPEAKDRLDEIARCAKTGAVKDQALIVVGRTDPTGPDSYNQQLGMSRAEAVARYLREQGVSEARVETASKGEAAASADPWHWPWDRRVTVRLQQ
jgi:outer membrane protein OmpA-like peptidoglycan-associated protein